MKSVQDMRMDHLVEPGASMAVVADLESVKWGRGGNAHRKGKSAVTNYEVREAFGDAASLVRLVAGSVWQCVAV